MQAKDQLEEQTWGASRTYLKSVLEHMLEAGRGVRELSEFALDSFGADFQPYLRQFLHEVGHGRVSVKGLGHAAQVALAEKSVSREEREHMIREAAYLRAERRGFCGGSAEQDWLVAEQEIDLCLAQGPGLVVRGGKAQSAVLAAAQEKPAGRRDVVNRWLGDRFAPPEKGRSKKAAPRARKTRSGSASATAPRTAAPKGSAVPRAKKKTPGKNAAAGKKAATGKAATKKPAAAKKATATKKTAATNKTAATKKATGAKKTGGTKKRVTTAQKKTASRKRATGKATASRRSR